MLQAHRLHVAERAALGIPPLPLSARQTADLVELLKAPPAGEESTLLELITHRVPAGVDDAAKVKASYLAAVAHGSQACPLIDRVKASVDQFHKENPDYQGPIPSDLLTTSDSGLDPHISPGSAAAQVARVAKARGVSADRVNQLVAQCTQDASLGFLGEPRVNVLMLNLALDSQIAKKQ